MTPLRTCFSSKGLIMSVWVAIRRIHLSLLIAMRSSLVPPEVSETLIYQEAVRKVPGGDRHPFPTRFVVPDSRDNPMIFPDFVDNARIHGYYPGKRPSV